jgi:hypothetical protein
MKKVIILLAALAAATVVAQDKSIVTVKSGEVNNGVIILTANQADPVQQGKASFLLQCNKGQHECAVPAPGNYLMVRLPENRGMYDCANVELYPASEDPQISRKIGEYCLVDK